MMLSAHPVAGGSLTLAGSSWFFRLKFGFPYLMVGMVSGERERQRETHSKRETGREKEKGSQGHQKQGAGVAQLGECPTLDFGSGHDPRVVGSSYYPPYRMLSRLRGQPG